MLQLEGGVLTSAAMLIDHRIICIEDFTTTFKLTGLFSSIVKIVEVVAYYQEINPCNKIHKCLKKTANLI